MVLEKFDILKKKELDSFPLTLHKNLLKMDYLNAKQTWNSNWWGKTLQDKGIGKDFLNKAPVSQEMVPMIDRWSAMKLKSIYTSKEATEWRDTLKNGKSPCWLDIWQEINI